MTTQTFIIKSLLVQNSIMLVSLGVVVFFVAMALIKKRPRHLLAGIVWTAMVLWFFNSAYFGFSALSVGPEGIRLDYGILSLRNDLLPIDSPWEIEAVSPDIRKLKKIYFIRIGKHDSMRVKGGEEQLILEKIGDAIESVKRGS
jgi:hypothetical protein